jgi:RNA polymerase sigma factor (sigma-70 family)
MSDDRLVEQLRRGNESAFEVVYDRHHRGILGFCRHMLRSQEEAEDAVQHTFISAYNDLVGSDKPIRLKAWLYTIARNRCLSMLRSRREQAELPEELPTAGLSDAVLERDDLRRLIADVHGLPEDQRAALVLSELGDLSHAEIAGVVGCETVKVKALVFQARSSLMESRRASEISCQEIREELATARGGALRRGPLRRHVRSCTGCAEFREQVTAQRRMLALALPVVPTLGLKHAVLASVGGGHAAAAGGAALGGGAVGGGAAGTTTLASAGGAASAGGVGGAAAGGAAGGTSLLSAIGTTAIAKVAVVAVVAAGGSAVAISQVAKHHGSNSKNTPGAKDGKWVDTDGDGKPDTPAGAAAAGAANGGKAGGSPTAVNARELAAEKRAAAKARERKDGFAANGNHRAKGHTKAHGKDDPTATGDGTPTTTDETAPGKGGKHSGGHGSGGTTNIGSGSDTHPTHPAHPSHPATPPPTTPPPSSGNNGNHYGQIKNGDG